MGMRSVTLLAILALAVSSFASNAPDWVVGSYKLELSSDLKAASQKLSMPEPYARIMLRPDGTFSYASNNAGNVSGTNGTFEVSDHKIKLVANDVFPAQQVKSLSGNAQQGALDIDGLHYVKVGAPAVGGAGFDVTGTWNVSDAGQVNKSIKMTFKANSTFEFSGMSATSKGRFELDGAKLTLVWTTVDGEAVEAGSMKKVLRLREDGSFNIDTYRYVRS
jgi:hypothetical protein